MFSPVLEALFLRARDQHASNNRRSHLAVLALALFHAAILSPLVELESRESAAAAEARRIADLATEVAELGPLLDEGDARAAIEPALHRLIEGLRRDLARLEATWRRLADAAAGAGEGEPAAGATPDGAVPFEIENPGWLVAIREAGSRFATRGATGAGRYGLLAALDPAAEELVIKPQFAALNGAWKADVLPRLQGKLDAAAGAVPRLRERFPEAGAEWGAFDDALGTLRQTARELAFEPPEQPYWWASPEGASAFEIGLTAAVEEQLRGPLALDELAATAGRARQRYGTLAARLERERERALLESEVRRRRAGELGGILRRLGIDLRAIAGLFPLLLGLLIAGILVARNRRLAELGEASRLIAAHGGLPELVPWCLARLRGGLAEGGASAGAAWRCGWLRALGILFLALAWIALAALQVQGLGELGSERWLLASALGAAAVLAATVHRLIIARRLVELLEHAPQPPPEPPASAAPSDDESRPEESRTEPEPVLDGHTLRR